MDSFLCLVSDSKRVLIITYFSTLFPEALFPLIITLYVKIYTDYQTINIFISFRIKVLVIVATNLVLFFLKIGVMCYQHPDQCPKGF